MGDGAPTLPPKVGAWKERCIETTSPHYDEAHQVMYKVKNKFQKMRNAKL